MTAIISVSVDEKQMLWIKEHKKDKECSPSFILRKAIHQQMQEKGEEYEEDIKSMRLKVEKFSSRFQKTLDFLGKKGLKDEFLEEQQQ